MIRYPLDIPQPMRDLSSPRSLIPVWLIGDLEGLVIIGLRPSAWDNGLASLDVRRGETAIRISLTCAKVDVCFLGREWTGDLAPHRADVASRIDEVLKHLLEYNGCAPSGTLGVVLGDAEEGLFSILPMTVVIDRHWLAEADDIAMRAGLLWQLSAVGWYVLARVHGKDPAALLFALRLRAAAAVAVAAVGDGFTPAKFNDFILARFGALKERYPELRPWYPIAVAATESVASWCARDDRASHTLQQVSSELCGNEVAIDWLRRRLKGAGLRLR